MAPAGPKKSVRKRSKKRSYASAPSTDHSAARCWVSVAGYPVLALIITAATVHDVRFPTAAAGDGSDAVNRGDYSASYVELTTAGGPTGAGVTFTNGRGYEITWAAIEALAHHVVGRRLADIIAEPVGFWRSLTADPQLRWLGPEMGVIHMVTGALVNAVWDLRAKVAGVPLWRLLAEMSTDELVGLDADTAHARVVAWLVGARHAPSDPAGTEPRRPSPPRSDGHRPRQHGLAGAG